MSLQELLRLGASNQASAAEGSGTPAAPEPIDLGEAVRKAAEAAEQKAERLRKEKERREQGDDRDSGRDRRGRNRSRSRERRRSKSAQRQQQRRRSRSHRSRSRRREMTRRGRSPRQGLERAERGREHPQRSERGGERPERSERGGERPECSERGGERPERSERVGDRSGAGERPRSRPRDRERPEEQPFELIPEKSTSEEPLYCAGAEGPIAAKRGPTSGWISVLADEVRRSFVSYRPKSFSEEKLREWFEHCHQELRWNRPEVNGRPLPRKACWLTAEGCSCTYRYGGTQWPNMVMPPWFVEITDEVCRLAGVTHRPNSCNANLYEDGNDSVGWHADDEPLFDAKNRDALILSLSLGSARNFYFRPNDDLSEVKKLCLEDGDLCTMEGLMQKHYCHSVPQERGVRGARINLTWRWVMVHDRECVKRNGRYPPVAVPHKAAPEVTEKKAAANAAAHAAAARFQSQALQMAAAAEESARAASAAPSLHRPSGGSTAFGKPVPLRQGSEGNHADGADVAEQAHPDEMAEPLSRSGRAPQKRQHSPAATKASEPKPDDAHRGGGSRSAVGRTGRRQEEDPILEKARKLRSLQSESAAPGESSEAGHPSHRQLGEAVASEPRDGKRPRHRPSMPSQAEPAPPAPLPEAEAPPIPPSSSSTATAEPERPVRKWKSRVNRPPETITARGPETEQNREAPNGRGRDAPALPEHPPEPPPERPVERERPQESRAAVHDRPPRERPPERPAERPPEPRAPEPSAPEPRAPEPRAPQPPARVYDRRLEARGAGDPLPGEEDVPLVPQQRSEEQRRPKEKPQRTEPARSRQGAEQEETQADAAHRRREKRRGEAAQARPQQQKDDRNGRQGGQELPEDNADSYQQDDRRLHVDSRGRQERSDEGNDADDRYPQHRHDQQDHDRRREDSRADEREHAGRGGKDEEEQPADQTKARRRLRRDDREVQQQPQQQPAERRNRRQKKQARNDDAADGDDDERHREEDDRHNDHNRDRARHDDRGHRQEEDARHHSKVDDRRDDFDGDDWEDDRDSRCREADADRRPRRESGRGHGEPQQSLRRQRRQPEQDDGDLGRDRQEDKAIRTKRRTSGASRHAADERGNEVGRGDDYNEDDAYDSYRGDEQSFDAEDSRQGNEDVTRRDRRGYDRDSRDEWEYDDREPGEGRTWRGAEARRREDTVQARSGAPRGARKRATSRKDAAEPSRPPPWREEARAQSSRVSLRASAGGRDTRNDRDMDDNFSEDDQERMSPAPAKGRRDGGGGAARDGQRLWRSRPSDAGSDTGGTSRQVHDSRDRYGDRLTLKPAPASGRGDEDRHRKSDRSNQYGRN
eukprot:TRINITY_DN3304_c0_g1_i4.p1 TRINITY_DN3304_c0_g1~~TRINITY_DN3304_c0_g1_i4.p1  ORF type:complete len:1335 (-),score=254.07 TRINITY_DN3304_c0_g1_i4:67-4071(-)